jgi:hypothetical protein
MSFAWFPVTDKKKMKTNDPPSMIIITNQAKTVLAILVFGEYSLFSQMISVGSAASSILIYSPKNFICG